MNHIRFVQRLQKRMAAMLSADERQAFDEAWTNAPERVCAESNPALFVQSCCGTIIFNHQDQEVRVDEEEDEDQVRIMNAAARKLAAYWTLRKRVFGAERFLMRLLYVRNDPHDQEDEDNEGILTADDIATLQTGFLQRLPDDDDEDPTTTQQHGRNPNPNPNPNPNRKVIFFDNSRTGPLLDGVQRRPARFRCLFFVVQNTLFNNSGIGTSSNNEKSHGGVVLIRFSNSMKTYWHKAQQILGLFECLPLPPQPSQHTLTHKHNHNLFLNVYHAPPGAHRIFARTLVSLFEQDLVAHSNNKNSATTTATTTTTSHHHTHTGNGNSHNHNTILRVKSFVGDSPQELLAELVSHGLKKDKLPCVTGGSYDIDSNPHRAGIQRFFLTTLSATGSHSLLSAGHHNNNHHHRSIQYHHDHDEDEYVRLLQARAERKKRLDRQYSERRRLRDKQEEQTLYTQYVQLDALNKQLRAEETRLRHMIAHAHTHILQQQTQIQTQQQAQVQTQPQVHVQKEIVTSIPLLPGIPSNNTVVSLWQQLQHLRYVHQQQLQLQQQQQQQQAIVRAVMQSSLLQQQQLLRMAQQMSNRSRCRSATSPRDHCHRPSPTHLAHRPPPPLTPATIVEQQQQQQQQQQRQWLCQQLLLARNNSRGK